MREQGKIMALLVQMVQILGHTMIRLLALAVAQVILLSYHMTM